MVLSIGEQCAPTVALERSPVTAIKTRSRAIIRGGRMVATKHDDNDAPACLWIVSANYL